MLIHYFHIGHNAPCLPSKIWRNHCFRFLVGITVVPREIPNNGHASFRGYTRYIMAYVKIVNLEKWPLHQGLEAGSWSHIPAPFHGNPPDHPSPHPFCFQIPHPAPRFLRIPLPQLRSNPESRQEISESRGPHRISVKSLIPRIFF